ncbi:serine/threonine-protein kinase [Dictyobacter aurantiacus]|uniref:non-specific serine/threonine protein kinase n=1 Tax=Dictyobacter aurantiacus TaxID=1936993 RepID=A0A401ZJH3_9CHLR|nr:serine/threonine-protein kinase [Dictyobacter aurantiacus]GCE06974.1 hypothetical protein KDAU_43030 [Dictyobacter aurantiacus]
MSGAQQENLVGRYLGNYRLVQLLGSGGFAQVYLGIHRHLETPAAIKVLHTQVKDQEQQSFLREARMIARLQHPHIVRILEFNIEDEMPYLVMQYSASGTLRQYFPREQAVPLERCLPYLKQVASALQYAHDHRVIHCDVKPENMLLDEKGDVFLSDFGIATQARSSRSVTISDVIGTVRYMAPEQLRGKPRPASDQYALAIIAYEWLCGQLPFQGKEYLAIARQHLTVPPPSLREHGIAISASIEQVILTALAKDPHQRYGQVQDFVEALEEALRSGRYIAPDSDRWQRRDLALLSSSRIGAGANTAVLTSSQSYLTVPDPHIPPEDLTEAPTDRVASIPTGGGAPLTGPTTANTPGKRVSRRATLLGLGAAGILVLGGAGLAWRELAPNLAAPVSHSRHPAPTTSSLPPATPDPVPTTPRATLLYTYQAQNMAISAVSWSPDGRYIVSSSSAGTVNKQVPADNVQVWEARTGKLSWKASIGSPVIAAAWAPDGHAIVVEGEVLADNVLDLTTLLGVDTGQAISHEDHGTAVDANGNNMIGDAYCVTWSADGKHLLIGYQGEVGIWTGAANDWPVLYRVGDKQKQITSVAWSPDGKYIIGGVNSGYVYQWNVGDAEKIASTYQMNLPNVLAVACSPDSQYIAAANVAAVQIWDSQGGLSYQKSYLTYAAPIAWSPDGKYIASAHSDQADFSIAIWEARTGRQVSTCGGHTAALTSLAWSKRGDMLASGSQDKTVRVWTFQA